jgi:hypothetical protein
VTSGAISPDGKYLLYSDAKGVHLKLIETGEVSQIALPEDQNGQQLQWDVAGWFPGGTHFLLNASSTATRKGFWKFSVIGGSRKRLREKGSAWSISPNGGEIAFGEKVWPRGGCQDLWVMNADGEEARRLAEFSSDTFIDAVAWSPGGTRLVYPKFSETADKSTMELETRDVNSGETRSLGDQGVLISPALLWLKDGRLLFTRQGDTQGFSCNLWAMWVNEKTGIAESGPQPVANWTGACAFMMSITSDFRELALLKGQWRSTTLVAELGPNGTPLKAPARLTVSDSLDIPSAWTLDSKEVLFTSTRNGRNQIFRQAWDSDNAELVAFEFPGPQLCCVSPDGQWLLAFTNADPSSPYSELRRLPVQGGPSSPVLKARNSMDNIARCATTPSTLCVLAERTADQKELIFTGFDAVNGRGPELLRLQTEPTAIYSWSVSFDGTKIAVMNAQEGRVHVRHLDGKPSEEIVPKGVTLGDALDWSADGKGLYIDYATKRGMALGYLDLRGNVRLVLEETIMQGAQGITTPWGIPSRDGKHLAINGTYPSSNAWMLENF